MENASKALLIAASVLIVILLIAMGMKIFNSTTGTGEQVEGVMSSTETSMFNNKFLQHIGYNKTVKDVNLLLNVIIANNSSNTRKVNVAIWDCNDYSIGSGSTNVISVINANMNNLTKVPINSKFKILVMKNWTAAGQESGYDEKGYVQYIVIQKY